jgi:hypothetical protein
VAAADARCAVIYAEGEALALEYDIDLRAVVLEEQQADAGTLADLLATALAMTDEVVVAIEDAAASDTRLGAVAGLARDDVLPAYATFFGLISDGRFADARQFPIAQGEAIFRLNAELEQLGFEHCFQSQLVNY